MSSTLDYRAEGKLLIKHGSEAVALKSAHDLLEQSGYQEKASLISMAACTHGRRSPDCVVTIAVQDQLIDGHKALSYIINAESEEELKHVTELLSTLPCLSAS